jgi:hypothetical protein
MLKSGIILALVDGHLSASGFPSRDVPTGKAAAPGIRVRDSPSRIFCGGAGASEETMEVMSHDRKEKNSAD